MAIIRHGAPLLMRGGTGPVALVQAADGVTEAGLERLASLSGSSPRLALTARRARALGAELDRVKGVVTLRSLDGMDLPTLRGLVDPTAGTPRASGQTLHFEPVGDLSCEAAAVQLAKIAALLPAALVATVAPPIENPLLWAADRGLPLARVEDVIAYRDAAGRTLRPVSEARVPLADAEEARVVMFRSDAGAGEHLAIVVGRPAGDGPVLARIHSECFTGDLLGSLRCDCGDQLRGAIRVMAAAGGGVLLYLAQEGRGIGLANKLRAYALQDLGLDTVDANEQLGFAPDERSYGPAAEMLRQLGFGAVRLMTNNPDKVTALTRHGIAIVERVPHAFPANRHNRAYLRAKAVRSGHLLPPPDRAANGGEQQDGVRPGRTDADDGGHGPSPAGGEAGGAARGGFGFPVGQGAGGDGT